MILSKERTRTLSDISKDIGLVFFASLFIGPFIAGSKIQWPVVILGLLLAVVSWLLSLFLIKS